MGNPDDSYLIENMAQEFWETVGGAGETGRFPRDIRAAITLAMPLEIYPVPALRVSHVLAWMRRARMSYRIGGRDRRLHGCLLADRGKGTVFVDASDADDEQRFTQAHELAHFLLDYQFPRQRALSALGPSILPILDGERAPTLDERVHAVMSGVHLGAMSHVMERPEGGLPTNLVIDIENRADRLALHLLLERNIEITFLGHYGQFKGRLSPPFSKNSLLRLAQYRAHQDMAKRCELARRFVVGKLSNQRTLLQRYQRQLDDPEMGLAIEQIGELLSKLTALPVEKPGVVRQVASGDNRVEGTPLETILGMEGAGGAAYFSSFGKFLSDPEQWPFPGRMKRPPTDPVNSLLSFGYSLLTNKVASAVQLVGFDHFIGYLHSSFYGTPALALDILEEFRPIIVDSVVLTLLNNRMLTPNDFVVELEAYRLRQDRRKVFFTKFEERLNEEITHPIFSYKVSYRRCIELQVRLLAKYLTGEIEAYPPFLVR